MRRVPLTLLLVEDHIPHSFQSAISFDKLTMCAQGASHLVLVGDHFPHFFHCVIIFGLIHMCAQGASHLVLVGDHFPHLFPRGYYFWFNSQCVRRVPLTLCLWETISRTFSKVLLILV